jgi:hypothetical protein
MSNSFSEIDNLLILIHPDDPMLLDPDFMSRLHYGGFVKRLPEINDDARAAIMGDDVPPPFRGMYVIDVYVDRLPDVVVHVLPSNTHYRSLIFKETILDMTEDEELGISADEPYVQLVYELRTVGTMNEGNSLAPEFNVVDDTDPTDDGQTHSAPRLLH